MYGTIECWREVFAYGTLECWREMGAYGTGEVVVIMSICESMGSSLELEMVSEIAMYSSLLAMFDMRAAKGLVNEKVEGDVVA